jgi:hypothetical protein
MKLSLLIFLFLIALPADMVSAQVAPGGFVPCEGDVCSACDLVSMTNVIITWLFGIMFIVFAIVMLVAGFGLVTSGGNQAALDAAKSKFRNAIIGIIIALAAWVIVDTIMRGLVKGDGDLGATFTGFGPWSEVQCQVQSKAFQWAGDPQSVGSGMTPLPGPAPTQCAGTACAPLTIPCANANSCSISPDLVDNFQAFHTAAGVPGARVTEGMPPTRQHKSVCHTNGTCIDYSKAGGMTAPEVVKVINAAKSNGLRPVYEVKTQTEKNNLVAAGAPAESVVVLGGWISAPHFSIYGY